MLKTILIILILSASSAHAGCDYPKIEYQGGCWSHEALQAHFDVNYPYEHGDEYHMSDYELELIDEPWSDEVLKDIHEN